MKSGKRDFERNTEGLKVSAAKKAQATHQRVLEAIDRLLREGQAVNFRSVQVAAGVSRGYLYANADLRTRIETQRQGVSPLRLVSGPVQEVGRTDRSKDMLLAAKDLKIKQMEAEVRRLKEENKRLHGRLYEMMGTKGQDIG